MSLAKRQKVVGASDEEAFQALVRALPEAGDDRLEALLPGDDARINLDHAAYEQYRVRLPHDTIPLSLTSGTLYPPNAAFIPAIRMCHKSTSDLDRFKMAVQHSQASWMVAANKRVLNPNRLGPLQYE
jgi:hypothetical protein